MKKYLVVCEAEFEGLEYHACQEYELADYPEAIRTLLIEDRVYWAFKDLNKQISQLQVSLHHATNILDSLGFEEDFEV